MATSATGRLLALLAMALMLATFAGCGGGDPDALEAASLSTGRWGHTATLLEDGRVLVVGGQESPSGKLATAEIYDPAADAWSSAGSMSVARGVGLRATRLSDGRVLVTGDSDEAIAEIYDPSNGQWSQAGIMTEPRNAATSTLMADGRVLVTGGGDATKAGQDPFASAEIFDPATGEWAAAGNMQFENYSHGAVLLEDGRVLIAGAELSEAYDPATDTWAAAGEPLRERTGGYPVILLSDGKVLVPGGEFKQRRRAGADPIRNVELYDPSTESWTRVADMNDAWSRHAAVLLNNGNVLVVAVRELQMYNTSTDMWASAGNLEQERGTYHTATVLQDGRVLIVGGQEEDDGGRLTGVSAVEIYDPATFQEEG